MFRLSLVFQCIIFQALLIAPEMSYADSSVRWGSYTWDHARLMPEGQTVIEFRGNTQAPESINTDAPSARSQGLGALSFRRTLRDALAKSKNSEELLKAAEAENVNLNQVISQASLRVSSVYTESQLRWAHSLTSWWMLGFNLPYVQTRTRVQVEASQNPAIRSDPSAMNLMANSGEPDFSIKEFREMIADRDWDQLSEEMYYNGLGNLELLSQVRLHESELTYLSFRQRFMVPAGANQRAYQPVPTGPDDGQLSVGTDLLLDWTPSRKSIFTFAVGYTWQLEDEIEARVPNESQSRWFWDIDPNVGRNLGDIVTGRLNTSYELVESYWITAGYEYFQKFSDRYEGSVFASDQYQRMQANTSLTRESARVGLRYQPPHVISAKRSKTYAAGLEYISTLPSETIPSIQGASLDVQVFF